MRRLLFTCLLFTCLLCCLVLPAHADDLFTPQRRAQVSSKLVGVSVIASCPTQKLIDTIQQEGKALHADYTVFPEVGGASLCPATFFGPLWSWSRVAIDASAGTDLDAGVWAFSGGVTVGLHYRVQQ